MSRSPSGSRIDHYSKKLNIRRKKPSKAKKTKELSFSKISSVFSYELGRFIMEYAKKINTNFINKKRDLHMMFVNEKKLVIRTP